MCRGADRRRAILLLVARQPQKNCGLELLRAHLIGGKPDTLERRQQCRGIIDWLGAGLFTPQPGAQTQQPDGVFTMIAAIGAELIRDRLLILLASLAITFANRFQIFAPRTFPILRSSFR